MSNHRTRSGAERIPLAQRTALGGHADFCPGGAAALAAAGGASHRGGVPLGAGFACGFAGGEDVGRGGGEAGGGPVYQSLAEAGGLLREAGRVLLNGFMRYAMRANFRRS